MLGPGLWLAHPQPGSGKPLGAEAGGDGKDLAPVKPAAEKPPSASLPINAPFKKSQFPAEAPSARKSIKAITSTSGEGQALAELRGSFRADRGRVINTKAAGVVGPSHVLVGWGRGQLGSLGWPGRGTGSQARAPGRLAVAVDEQDVQMTSLLCVSLSLSGNLVSNG